MRLQRTAVRTHRPGQDRLSPTGTGHFAIWRTDDRPEHHAEAERLLAVADRHTSGVAYGPEWTLTLAAAHVHSTLALAAATAVGTAGPDRPCVGRHRRQQARQQTGAPSSSPPSLGPEQRRPSPLFPPEDRSRRQRCHPWVTAKTFEQRRGRRCELEGCDWPLTQPGVPEVSFMYLAPLLWPLGM